MEKQPPKSPPTAPPTNVVTLQTGFQKGRAKTGGRKKGTPNKEPKKYPQLIKDCLLLAAELHGSDGKGKDKMVGFFSHLIKADIKSFAAMMNRIIPLEVLKHSTMKVDVTYESSADVKRELAMRGISPEVVQHLIKTGKGYRPAVKTIEHSPPAGPDKPLQ